MVIDTSALVAIVFREPVGARVVEAIGGASLASIGAPTLLETEMVVSARSGRPGVTALRELLAHLRVVETPFGSPERAAATEALLAYGKGRHPARLNLGDCLTYGVAKVADEPLLCVGGDFSRTDLALAALG